MLVLALALSVALVAYNIVTNLAVTREWVYLARNLAAGTALVVVAHTVGLTWRDLGLDPDALEAGLRWGRLVVLGAAVGAATAGALAAHVGAIERALADQRADLPPGRLAYHVLVRIPIGTAAFEEVAFRGVLLGVYAEAVGGAWAVAASSVTFGLWHIGPARLTAHLNDRTDPRAVRREIAVAVFVTTVGGVAFALLRLGSGSLLAPILAHASINAFGLLVAAVTQRTGAAVE
ncbi:MAG: CPBP family intramembrane metalloprotease [Actinobacteria bacterium]|nr:CPBP family intramembrane metalloprotease [Actinomycetota bacterium]